MTTSDIFTHFFRELERREIPYVVLHSYQDYPDKFRSDVDYAVADNRRHEIPEAERAVAQKCGWLIVQRMEHETCAFSSVFVNPQSPGETLMLDVTSHYIRNRCFFLHDEDLLAGRQRFKDFFIPCTSSEFIYTWVKVFAKFKEHAPYVERLRKLFEQEPERSQELFTRVFGPEAGRATDWWNKSAEEWKELGRTMHARNRYTAAQRWQEFRRIVHRVCNPTGLTVAFLGPDGAGKSTVIASTTNVLRQCFRRTMTVHFVPRLKSEEGSAPETNPQNQTPRSTLASWAKIFYYFACHWLHAILKRWPARIRTTLTIFDRTFDDLLVDPRRYRVQNSAWLVKLMRHFLLKPDLIFILDAPASVIQSRKTELSPDEIERQRAALHELAANNSRAAIINADQPAGEVSREVCRHIVELLAKRQESKM